MIAVAVGAVGGQLVQMGSWRELAGSLGHMTHPSRSFGDETLHTVGASCFKLLGLSAIRWPIGDSACRFSSQHRALGR